MTFFVPWTAPNDHNFCDNANFALAVTLKYSQRINDEKKKCLIFEYGSV